MDVHYESLFSVSDRIRRGEVRSVDVTGALLDRIARYDGQLHSTRLVLAEEAMEQAHQADAEIATADWRGPLHGVPIGIKDLLWTAGSPTTAGMDLLRGYQTQEDATIVTRLKAAGAVIIAKLHMTEGGGFDHDSRFPRPVNPWSSAHWTGISSSGSGVAAAAGFCFGAIGSDTGGSIRMPSSANNLTGIKPTWGRVSRHGLVPFAESFDHPGPMARSAEDAAAILQAIAGWDPKDPTSLSEAVPDYLGQKNEGVDGLTIGIDWRFAAGGLGDEVGAALENALTVLGGLGMKVREVVFPLEPRELPSYMAVAMSELALAHDLWFPAQADRYGRWMRDLLESAHKLKGTDVAAAQIRCERFRGSLRAMFEDVDLFLTPSLGKPVPTWENVDASDSDLMRFMAAFDLAGTPAISLPAGVDSAGLPLGIQLVGPWLSEPLLIRASVAFQQATDFHTRHPDLEGLPAG